MVLRQLTKLALDTFPDTSLTLIARFPSLFNFRLGLIIMCFSASASFTASAVLTATGALSVRRAAQLKGGIGLLSLSTFPVFFGIQQGFEGLVWLGMSETISTSLRDVAALGFMFFAFLFWPIASPVTGYFIETQPVRKKIFLFLIPTGIAVGAYLTYFTLINFKAPIAPTHWGSHLSYLIDARLIDHSEYVYFFTACAPLVFSSNRIAFRFGCALAASFAITMIGFQLTTLPSIWCFFASICSLIIVIELYQTKTKETKIKEVRYN